MPVVRPPRSGSCILCDTDTVASGANPSQARCHSDPWPFLFVRLIAEHGIQVLAAASLALNQRGGGSSPPSPTRSHSGCRKAWFIPPASEAGDRWFESSHPDYQRKGKPTGDGTPLETGRGFHALEGSTPSPSADRRARGRAAQASAFQAEQAGSTPAGHSVRSLTTWHASRTRPGRQSGRPLSLRTRDAVGSNPTWATETCPGGPAEWSSRSQCEDRGFESHPGYCELTCRPGIGEPRWL